MRRLKSILLALGAALAIVPGSARASAFIAGDVNGDGKVTVADAQLALGVAVGLSALQLNVSPADLVPVQNGKIGDGKVTVGDVIAILRLAVGMDTQAKYAASAPEAGGGDTGPIILPAVQFNIETPRGTYGTQEAIPFTITLRNNTDEEKKFELGGCQVDLVVKDAAGNAVYHPTEICPAIALILVLKPGESKEWKYVWYDDPNLDKKPRAEGTYTAYAELQGTDYKSAITFQVKDVGEPVPLPSDGPATFDLRPGQASHYYNVNKNYGDEVIRFLRYVKSGDNYYTLSTLVPDGMRDVLLRLDADGNLVQKTGDVESVRLKLNAKEGDTWTFETGGSPAKATLVSRSATLKTPTGVYSDLLQFDFFVGPDAGWTEWVHPKGFWVGYTRNTIAGPVEYRVGNRDFIGFAASSDSTYSAVLYPDFVQLNPGDTYPFNLLVADNTGTILKELPGPVKWSVDPQLGTIDQNGLFTAKTGPAGVDGLRGKVQADIQLPNATVTATGVINLGPMVGPPPVDPGNPGTVPPSRVGFLLNSSYVRLLPGAQFQFAPIFNDDNGNPVKLDNLKWSADANIGTIDPNGLFTAADLKEGQWGAVTATATTPDGSAVSASAKVYVGPDANDPPVPPTPAYPLKITPEYANPEPGAQIQFKAEYLSPTALAYRIVWRVDPDSNYGSITADGLFTASQVNGAAGVVYATAYVGNEAVAESAAKVLVGTSEPTPQYRIEFEQLYYYPQPGETTQIHAKLIGPDGAPVPAEFKYHLEDKANYGAITSDGLFTAGDKGTSGPIYADAIVNGEVVAENYTKVLVGGEPTPPPAPSPNERKAYLEGGTLTLGPSPTANATPSIMADITGAMPDPSWAYDRTETEVKGDTILLTPILKKVTDGPVPAVLKPFEAKVIVSGLVTGKTYTVIAVGDDTQLQATIKL